MIGVLDVAWYFVQKGSGDASITQLKLQKLCYYAQGFHLAVFGKPLFPESIEAWDYGPVVNELRRIHCHRGAETIYPDESAFGDAVTDYTVKVFLDNIWREFGHYSAGRLVDMTHSEDPWLEAYQQGCNIKISEKTMHNYFIPRKGQLIDCKQTEPMQDIITDIFLKDGSIAKVPLSKSEQYIEENKDLIGHGKINVKGKRRLAQECI
jgi:uncharacterized phage-associated protein